MFTLRADNNGATTTVTTDTYSDGRRLKPQRRKRRDSLGRGRRYWPWSCNPIRPRPSTWSGQCTSDTRILTLKSSKLNQRKVHTHKMFLESKSDYVTSFRSHDNFREQRTLKDNKPNKYFMTKWFFLGVCQALEYPLGVE